MFWFVSKSLCFPVSSSRVARDCAVPALSAHYTVWTQDPSGLGDAVLPAGGTCGRRAPKELAWRNQADTLAATAFVFKVNLFSRV